MVEKIIKMISNLKILSKMNEIIDGLNTHTTNTNNPHNVTAEQLGLATAYVYKGSVTNFSDLPTNAQNGWVYSVENEHTDSSGVIHSAGANFAWDGSKWDDLGGSLSGYATVDFVENRVIPIEKGGTGATTANGACKNLGAVQTVNGVAPDAKGNVEVSTSDVSNIVNIIYPVGSLYWSKKNTSPATLFGGTWTQIKDKFILAAGDSYAQGATGGSATVTLTTAQLPAHNHSGSAQSDGSHNHSASSNSTGAHTHTFTRPRGDKDYLSGSSNTWWGSSHVTVTTSSNGSHSHTITVNSGGAHTHTLTINNTGSGQAHENMPPYVTYYCWERTA